MKYSFIILVFILACQHNENKKLNSNYAELDSVLTDSYNRISFYRNNDAKRFYYYKEYNNPKILKLDSMLQGNDVIFKNSLHAIQHNIHCKDSLNYSYSLQLKSLVQKIEPHITQYEKEYFNMFMKKWNARHVYQFSDSDSMLNRLNISKLKLDLVMMVNEADDLLLMPFNIDNPLPYAPETFVFVDIYDSSETKYKAKLVYGQNYTKFAERILLKEIEYNGVTKQVNIDIPVREIPEIEIETKKTGNYRFMGFLQFKTPIGIKQVRFEKRFRK